MTTASVGRLVCIDQGIRKMSEDLAKLIPPLPPLPQLIERLETSIDTGGSVLQESLPPGPEYEVLDEPAASVTLVRVVRQPLGLGNQAGSHGNGPLALVPFLGDRLQAVVRFEVWGATNRDVDLAIDDLHRALLVLKERMRTMGFLALDVADTSVARFIPEVGAWCKSTSYGVVYEFLYPDPDAAGGLIARIEAEIAGLGQESMVVSNGMVLWSVHSAPPLEVHGGEPFTVRDLLLVYHWPQGSTSGPVVIEAQFQRDGGSASAYRKEYVNFDNFLGAFAPPVDKLKQKLKLGGEGFVVVHYLNSSDGIPFPLTLRGNDQFLRIRYGDQNAQPLPEGALVYLRVLR